MCTCMSMQPITGPFGGLVSRRPYGAAFTTSSDREEDPGNYIGSLYNHRHLVQDLTMRGYKYWWQLWDHPNLRKLGISCYDRTHTTGDYNSHRLESHYIPITQQPFIGLRPTSLWIRHPARRCRSTLASGTCLLAEQRLRATQCRTYWKHARI